VSTRVTGCAAGSWPKRCGTASICRRRPRSGSTGVSYSPSSGVYLFTRLVPIIRKIQLMGPKVRTAFEDMGVMAFADN
jgi:hypothetical protein